MMTNNPFNSAFENSLRILLILNECEMPQTTEMLGVIDFMAQYGKVFRLSDSNLNGENPYKFSEFLSKKMIIWEAIRYLVLHELVQPLCLEDGLKYIITPQGEEYCEMLSGEYADEYRRTVRRAMSNVSKYDEREIIATINHLSAASIEE